MVSAAKSSTSARDLSGAPTAYTAFQNSTSHTALLPRIMGADGVVFLCSFQDNTGPIGRARLDRGQTNRRRGQQNKGKVRRCSARAPLQHTDAESSEIEMGTQGSCRLMNPPTPRDARSSWATHGPSRSQCCQCERPPGQHSAAGGRYSKRTLSGSMRFPVECSWH